MVRETSAIPSTEMISDQVDGKTDTGDIGFVKGGVTCFAAGTFIETARGALAVETLRRGDLILTRDHGLQPIRWIGSIFLNANALAAHPKLRPICITAGALGIGVPVSDLMVSPQHRVLVRSKIAQKMFSCSEVLVAAKQLLILEGVDVAADFEAVEYFQLLLDRHEVVISNGAETESLYLGPQELNAVGDAAQAEIVTLFPELRNGDQPPASAREILSGRMARKLAMRHQLNGRYLVV